jgi:hypothetical protein
MANTPNLNLEKPALGATAWHTSWNSNADKIDAAAGAWITPTFAAGNFTASGAMTWTVDAGDVTTYAYNIRGKTMTIAFILVATTVAGTPSTELRIAVPTALVIAKTIGIPYRSGDNGSSAIGMARATAGNTYITLFKDMTEVGNWAAATNTTFAEGQITFEVV